MPFMRRGHGITQSHRAGAQSRGCSSPFLKAVTAASTRHLTVRVLWTSGGRTVLWILTDSPVSLGISCVDTHLSSRSASLFSPQSQIAESMRSPLLDTEPVVVSSLQRIMLPQVMHRNRRHLRLTLEQVRPTTREPRARRRALSSSPRSPPLRRRDSASVQPQREPAAQRS